MPMTKVTLKRVDAAIRRELDKAGFNTCHGRVEDFERALFLAGRESARLEIRDTLADDGWALTDRQQRIIKRTNSRLRKEMKANG